MPIPVIAIPGGVSPAALRYAPLQQALGEEVELHLKDLEVYSSDDPPAGYSTGLEVDALERFADSLGLDRFHLVSYSGGGYISLAFAGRHPDRLLSLATFEPARIPGAMTAEESGLTGRLGTALAGRGGPDFMRTFMQEQVRPGVVIEPPSGPPPPWMRNRPAGLQALMAAFTAYEFDRSLLRECRFPVLYAYGNLSGEYEEVKASVLARLLPDLRLRRIEGVHHFSTSERIYSPEHLQALRGLWRDGAEVARRRVAERQ